MGRKDNKSFRNVLASPKNSFWPLVEESKSETLLLDELRKVLNLAKTINPQVNWHTVRNLTKEERRNKINEFFENLPEEYKEFHKNARRLKQSLALGWNAVCRAIELDSLSCCLLHGQTKPKLLLENILRLAKSKNVPILLVNDLKQTMTESLGFPSIAIGFSKDIINDDNHESHQLCSLIINLSKQLSVDNEQAETVEVKMELEDEPNEEPIIKEENEIETKDLSTIYLMRESTHYRVFHPPQEDSSSDKVLHLCEEMADTAVKTENVHRSVQHIQCPVPNKKARRFFEEPNILRVQSNPDKLRKKKKKNTRL